VPTGLSLSVNDVAPGRTGITLSWSASSNGTNNAVTGYQVQRATSASGPWSAIVSSQTGTSLSVTSLTSNGSYFYRIIALAPMANSSASATIELRTVFTAPTAPGNAAVSPSSVGRGGSATLTWDASTGGTNNAFTSYRVERATSASGPWSTLSSSQTARTLAVTGQTVNNSSYFYRVIALAPYVNSSPSTVVQLQTSWQPPSTPTNLALSSNNVAPGASVTLSWSASTAGTNNPVTGYMIERSTSAGSGYTTLVSSQSGTSLAVVARDSGGQSYFYKVTALGAQGDSAPSSYIELKTVVGVISAPSNVRVNNTTSVTVSPASVVTLTWNASPAGTNNPVTGYKVYESTSATGTYNVIASVGASTLTKDVTVPTAASSRYYRIVATGTYSNSTQSGYVLATVSLTTSDASTVSMSPAGVNAGSSTTATVDPADPSYTHKVWITFGEHVSPEGNLAAGETTWSYTIPLGWLTTIPNSTSGTAKVTIETYSGDILKGRRTTNLIIYVPSTVVPSLASFTGTRVNNSVPASWGVYVVSKSQVDLVMGQGSGAYGSTITGYRLSGGGMNASSTTPISIRSNILTNTVTTYTATVTDSRNRTKTYTVSVTAEPYNPPSLDALSYRCDSAGSANDEGKYGYARAVSTFASVAGKNSVTISSKYRVRGSTGAYTTISNNMTSGTGIVFGNNALALDKYYEILYTVVDGVGTTVTFLDEIPVSPCIFHVKNNGKALGIGGPVTGDDTVDIHWNTRIRGYLTGENRRNSMYSASTDANNTTYEWDLNSGTNTPFGGIFAYINTIHYSTYNNKMQMAYSYNGGNRLAYRSVYGGTWQPWSELLTDRNYMDYALPLSGGTMSGNLTINTPGTQYIQVGVGRLRSNSNGATVLSGGQGHLYLRPLGDTDNAGQVIITQSGMTRSGYAVLDSNNYASYVTPAGIGAATPAFVSFNVGYFSQRDFANGTLVHTNIDYSQSGGNPWLLEITGNSYGNAIPFDIKAQGYIYNNTIINHGGISNGTNLSSLLALNIGGNLCFWWPRIAYWHGFTVRCFNASAGEQHNRVTNVVDSSDPGGTKRVSISITQSLHSNNYTGYALPLSGGTLTGSLTFPGNVTLAKDSSYNALRITNPSGYIQIGPLNTGTCHLYTDRGTFYFNKEIQVNGSQVLTSSNYSSYVTPSGIGAATSGHDHHGWYIRVNRDIWQNDNQGKPRWYWGGTGTTNGILLRASADNQTFQLRHTDNTIKFMVNMTTGVLTTGTVPWARLSGVPLYAHNPGRVVTDYNAAAFRESGMYGADGSGTNAPSGIAWLPLIVAKNVDVGLQIAGGYNKRRLWFRGWSGSGNTYYAWDEVLSTYNYSSYVLPLSGGTMTGNIRMYSQITSRYNDNVVIQDHMNGNISVSAAGAGLYLGYYNTQNIYARGSHINLDSGNFTSYVTPSAIGAAATSHSHSNYLPLAGGTITGKITVPTATRSAGVYGNYDSYKIGHVWSMGTSYVISNDGSGFGNLYGMAYKHTNNTAGGTMAGGHQIVFCNNGTPGVSIGLGGAIWSKGTITAPTFSGSLSGNASTASNASTVAGLAVHSGRNNEANKVVRTDANGYIQAGWINTTSGSASGTPTRIYCSQDAYIRYYAPSDATLRRSLGAYIRYGTSLPTSGNATGDIYILI
jgi:hypothetical protein